jgi:hypothetical protein
VIIVTNRGERKMPGLPIYEGRRDQVLDGYATAEPMGRSLDHALPTPDHAVGTPRLLEVFGSREPDDIPAAHIEAFESHGAPIAGIKETSRSLQPTNMPHVHIRYV